MANTGNLVHSQFTVVAIVIILLLIFTSLCCILEPKQTAAEAAATTAVLYGLNDYLYYFGVPDYTYNIMGPKTLF